MENNERQEPCDDKFSILLRYAALFDFQTPIEYSDTAGFERMLDEIKVLRTIDVDMVDELPRIP